MALTQSSAGTGPSMEVPGPLVSHAVVARKLTINKYVVELVGTFFLVLTIGMTVIAGGDGVIPPLAIGSILMAMIYAGGHISGGHYNPAVTLGVWIRGRCEGRDVAPYMLSQVVGAVLAAFAVRYMTQGVEVHVRALPVLPELLAEFLFTFALVFVVLNSATSKDNTGNSFYGLAIGFTVLVGAFAVGGIASAAFNPAVAVGISTMGLVSWSRLWIYLVANFSGGAVAALAFRMLSSDDR